MNVFPVIRGFFVWEYLDNGISLLFEVSNHKKHLRAGYRGHTLINADELTKYGKIISPRKCTFEQLKNALDKMDQDSFDGCCLVQYENTLELISSYNCHCAFLQFKEWLLKICEFCNTIEEVETMIKELHKDDLEMCYFCSKHFLYVIYTLLPLEDESVLECLKRQLKEEGHSEL